MCVHVHKNKPVTAFKLLHVHALVMIQIESPFLLPLQLQF